MSDIANRYGFNQHSVLDPERVQFAATQRCTFQSKGTEAIEFARRLAVNLEKDGWEVEKLTIAVRPGKGESTQVVYVNAFPPKVPLHECGSVLLPSGIDGKPTVCLACNFGVSMTKKVGPKPEPKKRKGEPTGIDRRGERRAK